jgi:hypothetical protein
MTVPRPDQSSLLRIPRRSSGVQHHIDNSAKAPYLLPCNANSISQRYDTKLHVTPSAIAIHIERSLSAAAASRSRALLGPSRKRAHHPGAVSPTEKTSTFLSRRLWAAVLHWQLSTMPRTHARSLTLESISPLLLTAHRSLLQLNSASLIYTLYCTLYAPTLHIVRPLP